MNVLLALLVGLCALVVGNIVHPWWLAAIIVASAIGLGYAAHRIEDWWSNR